MWNTLIKLCIPAPLVFTASGAMAALATTVQDESGFGEDPAHAEHAAGGLPQLDPTWYASQVFWLIVTFAALYGIFSKKILPSLSATLETRREHIEEDLDTAKKLRDEAEKVHEAYEDILQTARIQAANMLMEAESRIKTQAEKKLKEYRDRSSKEILKAEAGIEKAKKKAMSDMDGIAAEIASKAAEKIAGISADIDQAKTVIANINKVNKKAA